MVDLLPLANQALFMLGSDEITSINEDSTEGRVVKALIYESYDEYLTEYRWRFAQRSVKLNEILTNSVYQDAQLETGHYFQLPDDMIYLSRCSAYDWEIQGDVLICSDSEVRIEYTRTVDYKDTPAYFKAAMTRKFASEIAIPITDSTSRAQLFFNAYMDKSRIAKHLDSTQRSPDQIEDSPLIDVRY